jgi:hypothetical protein
MRIQCRLVANKWYEMKAGGKGGQKCRQKRWLETWVEKVVRNVGRIRNMGRKGGQKQSWVEMAVGNEGRQKWCKSSCLGIVDTL